MSGEITITPGKTFSGDAITDANLNLLGNPTGVVDADSIGSDELIEADVQTIAGAVARGVNYFRNGNFWKDRWQTPAGVSPAAGTRGFNARGWFCRPQGGAVAYARSTTAPSNELSLHSVLLTGASGVSTVEFGQFIPSYLAAQLQGLSITVSFQIKNDTGASLTAVARINVADAEDDEENLTNDTDVNFSAITATEWERVEATFDLSTISNIERGC